MRSSLGASKEEKLILSRRPRTELSAEKSPGRDPQQTEPKIEPRNATEQHSYGILGSTPLQKLEIPSMVTSTMKVLGGDDQSIKRLFTSRESPRKIKIERKELIPPIASLVVFNRPPTAASIAVSSTSFVKKTILD